MIIKDKKLSQDEADNLIQPMASDLIAYYKLLQNDILKVIDDNKDASPDEIIEKINEIFKEK